ncbi:MAG: glycosyltransferase family 2 protein [Acidobacteriota bacterium]
MRLSVALCTFNGAKYIGQQLESLAGQTRPPDELIVCDDCSADETVKMVREFAQRVPWPIRLEINPSNVGVTLNFDQAIQLCTGDVIALCDQDDFWLPQKLERIEAAFNDANVGLVFSDAEVVDGELKPLGYRLWSKTFPASYEREFERGNTMDILLYGQTVTGATMAFRADVKQLILPIPQLAAMMHDGWIAFLSAAVSRVKYISEPLMLYRQHDHQLVGATQKDPVDPPLRWFVPAARFAEGERQKLRAIHGRLVEWESKFPSSKAARRVRRRLTHLETRYRVEGSSLRRVLWAVRELVTLRYHRHSGGLRSFVEDLVIRG